MNDVPDRVGPDPEDITHAQEPPARAIETIGPYRLLLRLGEGGMGDVWLAEQTRPIHRQVALKIIKAGMDTAQVVARFEAERQALALMSHPAIAQVFDGGATPQGRPFFAMEYVRGEPITTYCNRHRLTTRQRIDLFLEVCEGVQHAHQKGIIHRDLKPSNILITVRDDRAVPKIIDFGVAKATTQSLTERTLHTEFGAMIGTPEYMSPEQAEMTGLDVDTRTDVYALGLVLYELLTGSPVVDAKSLREKPLDEIRRTIREVDPPRPSTRVSKRSGEVTPSVHGDAVVARELRGDLDWITMRALEKDRTRRYGSASDLAADLRRHLEHLPVVASPPSATYRSRKFIRRHRLGVIAAAAAAVVVLAFAATMGIQARRIGRERDRANREAAATKAVSDFLVSLFNVSNPSEARGNSLTAREVLDNGARQIEQNLGGQPELQARLQGTIGLVYTNLGLYAAAEPLVQSAIASNARVLGRDAPETITAINMLATIKWYRGQYDEAERLYREVIDRRKRTLGDMNRDTLKAQFDLASTLLVLRRWDEYERLAREVLKAQRRELGVNDPDTLESLNNLQYMYFQRKQFKDAEPIAKEVLEIRRRILGVDHPSTFLAMHNLGTIYAEVNRVSEAEQLETDALAGHRRVLGDVHPYTLSTWEGLARVYEKEQRFDVAETQLLAALHALDERGDAVPRLRSSVVKHLADLYREWGKPDKAAEWRAKLPKEPAIKPAAVR